MGAACHCDRMAWMWIDLAAVVLACGALVSPGVALERRWWAARFGESRGLAHAVLGLLCWYVVTFVAAMSGWFGRPLVEAFAGVAVASALLSVLLRRRRDATVGPDPGDRQPNDSPEAVRRCDEQRPRAWHFVVIAALMLPHFIRATSPVVAWDAATYHLTLPRRLLETGAFPPVDWLFYGAWPQLMELLYGAAMAVRDHVLAKGLHAAAGALWLIAMMTFAANRGARTAGVLAALAVIASPIVAYELPLAYVDLAQAALLLLAFGFGERAFRAESRGAAQAALWVAGIAAGLLAGTKLIGVAQAGLVGVLLLARGWRAPTDHVGPRDVLLRYGAVAIALWLPWPVRSAIETGNPVFPLLTAWFGGPHWSPELSANLAAWHHRIGMGRGAIDWLLLPWRVTTQGGAGYDHFAGDIGAHWLVVGGLAAAAITLQSEHRAWARRCVGLGAGLALLWAMTSQQARLLLPALGPCALAGGLGAATLIARLGDARRQRWAGAALVATIGVAIAMGPHRRHWDEARQLAALKSQYGRKLMWMAMPNEARFIARSLPQDSRILMLHTNQAFWIGRAVIADSTFEASQIADWIGTDATEAEVHAKLKAAGVSHILSAPPRWPGAARLYPEALTRLATDPKLCRPLFHDAEHRVCVVKKR